MVEQQLKAMGIIVRKVYRNLSPHELITHALKRDEGTLTHTGALLINTAPYTGRSPNDRFIVNDPSVSKDIAWGKVNKPLSHDNFLRLLTHMRGYLSMLPHAYVFDGCGGADPQCSLQVGVVTEHASHNLFAHQLLRRLIREELLSHTPSLTVLVAPGCVADSPKEFGINSEAFIVISLEAGIILIGGTGYAGEIKKALFSVMNYILPKKGILPMHCSANVGKDNDVALFLGLSGTGKTTLSADQERMLIGDDEHGWSEQGIFNFEGGCYAKCINLKKEKEPQIWEAIRHGALLENVVVREDGSHDFSDDSITENTRAGYPLHYIPNIVESGRGSHPKNIIFLTADASGVMPPVARLSAEQAMYHFMSGYTSKLAGTERGVTKPIATFSTLFGEPFMPMDPSVYAKLLKKYMQRYGATVYLVNTGWTGGPYGVGRRFDIATTRGIVSSILSGELVLARCRTDQIFGFSVPLSCNGVASSLLDPALTWDDRKGYEQKASELAGLFIRNFERFPDAPEETRSAGPKHQ